MKRRVRGLVIGAVALIVVGTGAVAGAAALGGDDDPPLVGETFDQASKKAVEVAGGGDVTDTEADDGRASYEVEVRLPDGRQVEVHLDQQFNSTGSEPDDNDDADDGPDDRDDDRDDDREDDHDDD